MATVIPFVQDEAFDPEAVCAMSRVLDDVCRALNVDDDRRARETIAVRIIELARRGERDAERLRQRVMREADPKRPAPPDPVLRWRGVK